MYQAKDNLNSADLKKQLNVTFRSLKREIATAMSKFIERICKKLVRLLSVIDALWSFAKVIPGNFYQTSLLLLHKLDESLTYTVKKMHNNDGRKHSLAVLSCVN